MFLTNRPISSKCVSSLLDCQIWRTIFINFDNCTPFCKPTAHRIIFRTTFPQTIKASSRSFFISSYNIDSATIYFDACMNASGSQQINKFGAILARISGSLIKQNDTRNILLNARSSKKEFTIGLSCGMIIFKLYLVEPLSNGSCGFVSSQDTFSMSSYIFYCQNKLLLLVFW